MKVVSVNIEELIPYVNNPRDNENAVDAVASSIKNFGFKSPIIVDGQNEIINGHTRWKAAKKLGLKEVPVVIADDLSPEKVKAYRLADNKTSELSEWNDELLAIELEELENLDFDMSGFGFDEHSEDIDLTDLWEEQEEGAAEKANVLKWEGGSVETTEDDESFLTDKLKQYKDEKPQESFVTWLVST